MNTDRIIDNFQAAWVDKLCNVDFLCYMGELNHLGVFATWIACLWLAFLLLVAVAGACSR